MTLGRYFNGMESASVVFAFQNPYSSHFRANYMRASVELVMLDRGTEPVVTLDIRAERRKNVDIYGDHIAKQDVILWSYQGDQMSPTHIAKGTTVMVILERNAFNFYISGAVIG